MASVESLLAHWQFERARGPFGCDRLTRARDAAKREAYARAAAELGRLVNQARTAPEELQALARELRRWADADEPAGVVPPSAEAAAIEGGTREWLLGAAMAFAACAADLASVAGARRR